MKEETMNNRSAVAKKIIGKTILYIVLITVSLIFILPLFQAVSYSLKTSAEMLDYPPKWLPKQPIIENYTVGLEFLQGIYPIFRWFMNSIFTTAVICIGSIISGLWIGYGFARFNGRGKNFWFIMILSTMMIPTYCVIVPQLQIFNFLHWTNTYLTLLVAPFFGSAMYIFFFRQFIMGIPNEIDESATIDGASPITIFFKIIVPLSKPAICSVGVLCFVSAWGDFFTPMIYLSDTNLYTISVGLSIIQTQVNTMLSNRQYIYVVTVLASMPCILVFLFAQKYFIGGLTLGAVKE